MSFNSKHNKACGSVENVPVKSSLFKLNVWNKDKTEWTDVKYSFWQQLQRNQSPKSLLADMTSAGNIAAYLKLQNNINQSIKHMKIFTAIYSMLISSTNYCDK